MTAPILIVGCGKMGSALVAGWLARGIAPTRIHIIEPAPGPALAGLSSAGVRGVAQVGELPPGFAPATIVLAIKPQAMDAGLPPLTPFMRGAPLVLSIAAGRPVAYLEARLGTQPGIVRAMPNTPAAIGRGISVLFAGRRANAAQRAEAEELMRAVGETAWIEDEVLMDAVTALSGSGPAYVFLLVEAMTDAGIAAGLDPALAQRLARATVAGSGAMLDRLPQDPATLRADVTSPGGTTAAALAVLMAADGLGALLRRAVTAAARRARELAS
ncbi:MAG: pyrroline-5-carboxylate reductase [Alphaproteobacteria bacterium]|nr:pyrroline-5-carboxylate reductase [Alphaproteobacteria bacterium]